MQKRNDFLSWEQFFISVAHVCALRSKDPNTQVGACVVNDINQIIATGYNGLPRGLSDDDFPWNREGDYLDTKYPYVIHAELNAILSARTNLQNCSIYVTLFPCSGCSKLIIQSGIKNVIFSDDKYADTSDNLAAKKLLTAANVKFRKAKKIKITVEAEVG
ncbi:dCMP deaminase family protein [Spiroplasma endosymbiont of Anurida maritima]|uniref:deoxycytidylate deaminase n=1 Tax=Spiroplasma endosymbiont of Anurida maritima TaxID=2967972 RepID=UPI0036D41E99